jgi:hypothetical protein
MASSREICYCPNATGRSGRAIDAHYRNADCYRLVNGRWVRP